MDYKFLDKVIDQIVSETMVESSVIHPPFLHPFSTSFSHPHTFFLSTFKNHCKDVYGLKDEQELDYVWEKYKIIITDKIKSKDNINESHYGQDDKFLDKVLNSLVDGTNMVDDRLITPYVNDSAVPTKYYILSSGSHIPFIFSDYCQNVYGLRFYEIKDTWKKYKTMVIDKVFIMKKINESRETDKKFLDKVAEQIMSETVIKMVTDDDGSVDGSFKTPFNGIHPLFNDFTPHFTNNFYTHCVEVYSIKDYDEIHQIWDKYKSLVRTETGQPQREYQSNRLF